MLGIISFFISTIVSIIVISIVLCTPSYTKTNNRAFVVLIISMLICIFCICGFIVKDFQPVVIDEEPYKIHYLYSLEDNNLTNGRGYYRRIRFNTDLYYQYMYKVGSGYKYHKIQADRTTVFEDNALPRIEFYEVHQRWFIFENVYTYYKIYVPKATIVEEYNVDLE